MANELGLDSVSSPDGSPVVMKSGGDKEGINSNDIGSATAKTRNSNTIIDGDHTKVSTSQGISKHTPESNIHLHATTSSADEADLTTED